MTQLGWLGRKTSTQNLHAVDMYNSLCSLSTVICSLCSEIDCRPSSILIPYGRGAFKEYNICFRGEMKRCQYFH